MIYREKIIKLLKSPAIHDIWQWSMASHLSILYICILNFIVSVGLLVNTIATRGLIDGATDHDKGQILFYAIVMSVTVLVTRGCYLLSSLLETRTSAVLLGDLRSMMLKKIMKKQYAGLDGFHSGELVNRMFSDVSVVRNGIMEIMPGLVSMSVSLFGGAIILIRIDWRFAALLVLGGLLGLALLVVSRKPIKNRHREVQESEGRLHAVLQETLANLRLIKASGSEKRMERQAEARQSGFLKAQLRKGYFAACLNCSMSIVFQLSWLFCMLWGCLGIYRGHLTYGMLAAIVQLVGQIQGPLSGVAGVAGQVYGTISSAERIKEMIDLPEEEEVIRVDGNELYRQLREIRMNDVDFSYGRGTNLVLEQVNVSIRPGDFAAVTGVSGGGKSTLFQLLLGIYQPCGGSIEFRLEDGTMNKASCRTRALFAYVPQGNTLFSGTLRENFTMFTDFSTDEEIMRAAKTACIDQLIEGLADGLDTVIGERGIGLSEGQAQRVAVARALLSGAPILLLDESTSALDEETEAELLRNIAQLKEKTCLIVTHRKAALSICDYRIHIEKAKVRVMEPNASPGTFSEYTL